MHLSQNIDCSEIERAFTNHPAVRECSVFGLPDERLGEVVGAAIWLTDTGVSKAALREFVGQDLAKFKVCCIRLFAANSDAISCNRRGLFGKHA